MEQNDGVVETTEETVDVEALKSQLTQLQAENAKFRNIKSELVKERDALKKKQATEGSEDYKTLYQSQVEENNKLLGNVKKTAINLALKDQLIKNGVMTEAAEAALKLVDTNLINFDLESGVDNFGVETAVKSLRNSYKFLFEKKVTATGNPKLPADGFTRSETEMTRKDFDSIKDPMKKAEAARKFTIIE